MVVNYKERLLGPLLFFLLFVLVCLIGFPLWALLNRAAPPGVLILAIGLGLLYLFMIVRTLSFNARVRKDPRALQWDSLGLSLWQDGRTQRLQWPQVDEISVQPGRRPSYPSFLKIATTGPDGYVTRWRFSSGRLQLSGQPLEAISEQINRARNGDAAPPPAPTSEERQASIARYEERAAKARAIVAIVMSVYFVTLFAMIAFLWSPNTMLLTPHDPLLWRAANVGFFATSGAILLWYLKTISSIPKISARVSLSFLPTVMAPGLFFAAMIGLWAYLAANVYVTDKTWGGHIEHGTVLMRVEEPMITHRGRPNVEARLLDRPGQDVFFTIDESDANLLRRWHDPGYTDEPACLTVPVQWAGYAIRSEVSTDTPLPKGSLSTCS